MNACVPTNRSFCSKKKAAAKPRSKEAKARMDFFRTHDIKIITDPERGIARMEVTKKE